jgi:hypothetical protein
MRKLTRELITTSYNYKLLECYTKQESYNYSNYISKQTLYK